MLTLEGTIILIGWFTSLAVALIMGAYIIPRLAAKRVSEQFGLKMVHQDGKKFFAPVGPDGKPVKIPIGFNGEGADAVAIMGYAPLAYSLPFITADMAAIKVKMALLNIKGNISKKISAEALKTGDPNLIMEFLPKKAQAAVAIAQMLGLGRGFLAQGGATEGFKVSGRGSGEI